MLKKVLAITLAFMLVATLGGCSGGDDSDDFSYIVVYEDIPADDSDKDKGTSSKDKTSSKEDTSSNDDTSSKDDTSSTTQNNDESDDFLTTYKIKGLKEKNEKLEPEITRYQNGLKKLGKGYDAFSYPKYSGKAAEDELNWLTDYNKKLTAYCADMRALLIKTGRDSVKNGVSGDISKAYEWATYAFQKSDNLVALTYDDAPNEDTKDLLDGLKERNVPAVFFLIGKNIKSSNESLIKRMIDEGHIVGNHSMSHVPLYHATKSDKTTPLDPERDVLELSEILESKFGYNDFLLRVPGLIYAKSGTGNAPNGKYDAKTLSTNNNLVLVDTNTSFGDADGSKPSSDIYSALVKQAKPGSIVLMHVKTPSVDASMKFIDDMEPQGYTFVTVPELLMVYNGKIDLGVAYKSYNTYATLP
ncbi:MAG: polysaccharide deacetylase family protein [Clostridia bacterium]|nr:polysaccharide deacetylase family protein [Clostridia bacterium]